MLLKMPSLTLGRNSPASTALQKAGCGYWGADGNIAPGNTLPVVQMLLGWIPSLQISFLNRRLQHLPLTPMSSPCSLKQWLPKETPGGTCREEVWQGSTDCHRKVPLSAKPWQGLGRALHILGHKKKAPVDWFKNVPMQSQIPLKQNWSLWCANCPLKGSFNYPPRSARF